jgi:hypothetical protein
MRLSRKPSATQKHCCTWCSRVLNPAKHAVATRHECCAGESSGTVSPLPLSLGPASAGQRNSSSSAAPGATATLSALDANPQRRQAVRRAMLALADQEPFLDMVAAALQQAGYKL